MARHRGERAVPVRDLDLCKGISLIPPAMSPEAPSWLVPLLLVLNAGSLACLSYPVVQAAGGADGGEEPAERA